MTHEDELIELLATATKEVQDDGILEQQRASIEKVFRDFGLQGKIIRSYSAPQVNCFDFAPGAGEKLFAYKEIIANMRAELREMSVRMLLPMPGTDECRLEVPKAQRSFVLAGDLFRSQEWHDSQATLPLMLGKAIDGKNIILDLAKAPHLLIGGTTGCGKSVLLDQCLLSLMLRHSPDDLKLVLFDPMVVEFQKYKDLPYLQFPVITAPEDMLRALEWLKEEMDRRYKVLAEFPCKNIRAINEQKPGSLPYIVVIFNELADYCLEAARSQMETLLSQLCAKSRAVGMHFIISTQRPDSGVLPGILLANCPTRIAFKTAERNASQLILGTDGAQDLLGLGDMLFIGPGGDEKRIQGGYADVNETARIIERVTSIYGDMKANALPHTHCRERNQINVIHGKLVNIVRDVLEGNLDWLKDNIIDDTCNEIADAIIENWDELQWHEDSSKTNAESNDDSKLLMKAVQIVIESRRPSTSYIQRMLEIGYNKACHLIEAMEKYGILSQPRRTGERRILVENIEEAIQLLSNSNQN